MKCPTLLLFGLCDDIDYYISMLHPDGWKWRSDLMDILYVVHIGYYVSICCMVLESNNIWWIDFVFIADNILYKFYELGVTSKKFSKAYFSVYLSFVHL